MQRWQAGSSAHKRRYPEALHLHRMCSLAGRRGAGHDLAVCVFRRVTEQGRRAERARRRAHAGDARATAGLRAAQQHATGAGGWVESRQVDRRWERGRRLARAIGPLGLQLQQHISRGLEPMLKRTLTIGPYDPLYCEDSKALLNKVNFKSKSLL
eukprot:366273-Chlamydomonas_euryale.AAC.1